MKVWENSKKLLKHSPARVPTARSPQPAVHIFYKQETYDSGPCSRPKCCLFGLNARRRAFITKTKTM